MKPYAWYLLVAIFLATGFVLFLSEPEPFTIRSEDRRAVLTGVSAARERPRIMWQEELIGPYTTVSPPVYEVTPTTPFAVPYTLTVLPDPSLAGLPLTLAVYDEASSAWRPVPTEVDPVAFELRADISHGGLWATSQIPVVNEPAAAAQLFSDLLDGASSRAVGYEAELMVSTIVGDFTIADSAYAEGGCNGQFRHGTEEQITSLERVAGGQLLRLQIVWQLDRGCGETEELRPLP